MARQCAVGKKILKDGREQFICDESRSELLGTLQAIQDRKGYISDSDMQDVADQYGIHPVEVYSVVTFYSFLNIHKKGRHIIRVSNCISNDMAGSSKIVKDLEKLLKIKMGETTKDKKFTLELTSCLGMCDKAPAIMIDNKLIGKVTAKKIKSILKEFR